jgi:hypothetical protein
MVFVGSKSALNQVSILISSKFLFHNTFNAQLQYGCDTTRQLRLAGISNGLSFIPPQKTGEETLRDDDSNIAHRQRVVFRSAAFL